MSIPVQAILGLLMMGIGGLKTWLHIGSLPVLTLQTCNGKTLNIALAETNGLAHFHCWGCYAFVVGLALIMFAASQLMRERRSVASLMD